ncbi:hypothetical protein [Geodermatophilus sp. URMC 60]|jgi:hypothetical protein
MSARELPMIKSRARLHAAATQRARVRVRGTVAAIGDGYSGTYRNSWLRIATAAGDVRVTASTRSTLGTMPVGSSVELATTLTGIVDVAEVVYFGERAQLLGWSRVEEEAAG